MSMSGDFLAYPGSHPFWHLHWVQNALILFVLFPTLATMYTQNPIFTAPLTRPLGRLCRRSERELVVLIHIWAGICLAVLVPAHGILWWNSGTPLHLLFFGPVSFGDLLRPSGVAELVLTNWVTTIVTGCFMAMAVTGPPLYAKDRPDTVLPFWRLDYATCKKVSRIAFMALVLTLDYHIFIVKSRIWTGWALAPNAFGVLAIAMAIVQVVMTVLVVLMIREWIVAGIGKGRPWKIAGPGRGAAAWEGPPGR